MDRHFLCQSPGPALRARVHELWDFQRPGAGSWHSGAPKPFVEIVFNLDAPFDWRPFDGAPVTRFTYGWITPIQTAARQARPDRDIRLVGARLYPAAALLNFGPLPRGDGTPPLALALADPWFARTRKRLLAAADAPARLLCLEQALIDRIAGHQDGIAANPESSSVADLARQMGCDDRELRRRFQAHMAISPKTWLRLARLDRVLRDPGFADPSVTIAAIACKHDFADQAHLAREFRLLLGRSADTLRSAIRSDPGAPPHYLG